MNNLQRFIKNHSSTILSIIGSIGVITTSVLAVKATPKAMKIIEIEESMQNRTLKPIEKVQIAWKPYIPAIFSGFSTIVCIMGANAINKHTQASLISAYALLDNSYKEYVEKTKELYGEEADDNIRNEIAKDHNLEEKNKISSGDQLFFMNDVLDAEKRLNAEFAARGLITLNDFYDFLGIGRVSYGYDIGWYDEGEYYEIEFEHQKITIDGDLSCYAIEFVNEPNMLPNVYSHNKHIL